jgi:hypothetical protein
MFYFSFLNPKDNVVSYQFRLVHLFNNLNKFHFCGNIICVIYAENNLPSGISNLDGVYSKAYDLAPIFIKY